MKTYSAYRIVHSGNGRTSFSNGRTLTFAELADWCARETSVEMVGVFDTRDEALAVQLEMEKAHQNTHENKL